jgi:2-polyprenyl-3-methyl-5-hydroxy-6-metoxy-1,4-benzoquinol methylase
MVPAIIKNMVRRSAVGGASDARWEMFVDREPYFAVLTSPKYLRRNFTAINEREFFQSGETFVDWALRIIEQRLIPHFAPASILEYGCGVGRLAIPFARRPGSITAVDLSPTMLAVAGREASKCGISHIRFQTVSEFQAHDRVFDLVNCYSVFQQVRQDGGLVLLRELIERIGPGGVGVFHFPYQLTSSRLVRVTRWLRSAAPGLNSVVNIARGTALRDPFIPTYAYDLDAVLRTFAEYSIDTTYVLFEEEPGFAAATFFVQMPLPSANGVNASIPSSPAQLTQQASHDIGSVIQVRQLLNGASIEDLNRRAEEYFASLTAWEHHLAKPFSTPEESATLLINLGTLLQGLGLFPGATVLDFGAGTGWLSRMLTQLGCQVALLDVSPTALRIARELYERVPIVGDRPAPQFLVFDGARIQLPEESVDRIVSFDAFHHVPNPEAVLREFARVLKPGGTAAFAEPGPRHSETPQSQHEMRTYGVVENDIDVHAIWRMARTCGFRDLRMIVFHGLPFHVSLEEFEQLLAGRDASSAEWVGSTRRFLRHVRHFLLFKEGSERRDSRRPEGLACDIRVIGAPIAVEGQSPVIDVTVTNSGSTIWLPSDAIAGGVRLAAHLYDEAGTLLKFNAHSQPLATPPREIHPAETVSARIAIAPQPAGRYKVELDCVAVGVTWFGQAGSRPIVVSIEVFRPVDEGTL